LHEPRFMEALIKGEGDEQAEALRAITRESVKERREQILEWWKKQLTEDKDTDFINYLRRRSR
jgi:hypothetical protein